MPSGIGLTAEVQYGKHGSTLPSCTSLSFFISMQQDLHQRNGPSPSRPAGSLHFRKTTGLIIHKRKTEDVEPHRHTKIHLVPNGDLQLMTEVFSTPYKTTMQWSLPCTCLTWPSLTARIDSHLRWILVFWTWNPDNQGNL